VRCKEGSQHFSVCKFTPTFPFIPTLIPHTVVNLVTHFIDVQQQQILQLLYQPWMLQFSDSWTKSVC
jgi:hypothetical protein